MSRKRAEFTLKTKLESMARYLRCPGVPEKQVTCGQPFGKLSAVRFDHIAAETFTHDNSAENCRPLCEACHALKTDGNGATSAGSDKHMSAKVKRLRGETGQSRMGRRMRGGKSDRFKCALTADGPQWVDRETGMPVRRRQP